MCGRIKSQRGNVIAYLLVFGVAWFIFFGIWNWIKETKEARYQKTTQQERYYGDPYLDNAVREGE